MKARETAIICAAGVAAVGVLSIPFAVRGDNGAPLDYLVWIVPLVVAGLGIVLRYRYLAALNDASR